MRLGGFLYLFGLVLLRDTLAGVYIKVGDAVNGSIALGRSKVV